MTTGYDENARWSHPVRPDDGAPGDLERRIGPMDLPYTVSHGLLGFHRRPESDADVSRCLTYAAFWVPRWPDKNGQYGFGTSPQYAIRNDYGRYSLENIIDVIREHAWDGKS